ncbi:hypothetical protein IMG5_095010, partial [Ichthyophthirius multifiliis]
IKIKKSYFPSIIRRSPIILNIPFLIQLIDIIIIIITQLLINYLLIFSKIVLQINHTPTQIDILWVYIIKNIIKKRNNGNHLNIFFFNIFFICTGKSQIFFLINSLIFQTIIICQLFQLQINQKFNLSKKDFSSQFSGQNILNSKGISSKKVKKGSVFSKTEQKYSFSSQLQYNKNHQKDQLQSTQQPYLLPYVNEKGCDSGFKSRAKSNQIGGGKCQFYQPFVYNNFFQKISFKTLFLKSFHFLANLFYQSDIKQPYFLDFQTILANSFNQITVSVLLLIQVDNNSSFSSNKNLKTRCFCTFLNVPLFQTIILVGNRFKAYLKPSKNKIFHSFYSLQSLFMFKCSSKIHFLISYFSYLLQIFFIFNKVLNNFFLDFFENFLSYLTSQYIINKSFSNSNRSQQFFQKIISGTGNDLNLHKLLNLANYFTLGLQLDKSKDFIILLPFTKGIQTIKTANQGHFSNTLVPQWAIRYPYKSSMDIFSVEGRVSWLKEEVIINKL